MSRPFTPPPPETCAPLPAPPRTVAEVEARLSLSAGKMFRRRSQSAAIVVEVLRAPLCVARRTLYGARLRVTALWCLGAGLLELVDGGALRPTPAGEAVLADAERLGL